MRALCKLPRALQAFRYIVIVFCLFLTCSDHILTLFLGRFSCQSLFLRRRRGVRLKPMPGTPGLHLSLLHYGALYTYHIILSRLDFFWRGSCCWGAFDLTHMRWPFPLSQSILQQFSRGLLWILAHPAAPLWSVTCSLFHTKLAWAGQSVHPRRCHIVGRGCFPHSNPDLLLRRACTLLPRWLWSCSIQLDPPFSSSSLAHYPTDGTCSSSVSRGEIWNRVGVCPMALTHSGAWITD